MRASEKQIGSRQKMDDKELRKLKKSELLEILLYMRKEIDALREENQRLAEKAEKGSPESVMEEILKTVRMNSDKLDMFCGWLLAENEDNTEPRK